jgi:signal transduction histidine kinase
MMRVASSLTNRIFLACAVLATMSLGFAFYFVNARVSAEAEADLRRGVQDAAALVDVRRQNLTETFTTVARMVADLPKFKAAVETSDPPTVQPLADEYRERMNADVLMVTGRNGVVIAASGAEADSLRAVRMAPDSADEESTFIAHDRGVLQVISVPVFIGLEEPLDLFGRLVVGFFMDDAAAMRFRELTGSDVAFAAEGRVLASSLPADKRAGLQGLKPSADPATVQLGNEEYVALARPMLAAGASAAGAEDHVPATLVLRSRTERLRFLDTLRAGLAGTLVVTVLFATVLSYLVARTVTRPLAAVTTAMRDVAATGDLTRKVGVRSRAWDDEDARLLATAFNTLTESIATFQREGAQKERLSSLGRLATVVAHEIRNPLMIIRASLASLWAEDVTPAERREAVSDIDEETKRLNRIVTEVLDFAKPIRFDLGEAHVNDICRASSAAAWADTADARVTLDLDPDIPTVVTDGERLRTALVNILTNARHAVEEANGAAVDPVVVRTRRRGDRVVLTVRDRGNGITPEDMAHIFDPYFTTRRAGTGLGLPISKNIIEGLGGSLSVSSRPGDGTEIRIELPVTATRRQTGVRGGVPERV